MLKKTLVLLVVVVLLVGIMVFPVSASPVKKVYTLSDAIYDWTDGLYNYYKLEIPAEHFSINVVEDSTDTSLNSTSLKNTVTLTRDKKYDIVYALKPTHLISLDGLPDEFRFQVYWNIESTGSYETPIARAFNDYYAMNGVGSEPTYSARELRQLNVDGTGRYPVTSLSYTDYRYHHNSGNGINSFRFGLSFRQLIPLNTGSYTFKLNEVIITFFIPVAIAQQSQIDALAQEQQNMAEQQEITNEKLDQMPEQIGDEFQGVMDKEKEEASSAADGAAGEMLDIIPNESQGFMDAMQSLVGAMSYTGTSAKMPIPPIKIPAIAGVMPEIKLTDNLEVDFGYWVGKLPANVLSLVQIVCTIALIVYCFKELYSTIAYAMTLKGGGSGE